MIGRTRQAGDAQVAFERNDLGFARHAGKAEPTRKQPFIHDAVGAEILVAVPSATTAPNSRA